MPFLGWLAKLLATPGVLDSLPDVFRPLVAAFLASQSKAAETRGKIIQAKAAGKIAVNEERAEALRAASKRLSDNP